MALLNNKGWLLACLLLLAGTLVRAQESVGKPVTLHLTKSRVDSVLQLLENQSGVRIFYDTAELDTTRIDVNADQAPLTKVLDQVFAGTETSYSIDRYQHVFVTKGEAIRTDLPPGYFDKPSARGDLAGADTLRDYLSEVGQPQVATLENKLYVIGGFGYMPFGNPPGLVYEYDPEIGRASCRERV